MKKFRFELSWEESVEKLYEYIISHCSAVFEIPNCEVVFRIIPENIRKELTVIVFRDEKTAETFVDGLNESDFSYTAEKYQTIRINREDEIADVRIRNGMICLTNREIRYVKYNREKIWIELAKMYYEISNLCLKIPSHEANLTYNSLKDGIVYSGIYRPKGRQQEKESEETDITNRVKKCFI